MSSKQYYYQNHQNIESILADKILTENLVSAYQSVFSDPDLWDESYTELEVLNNLHHQLSGKAEIRLCLEDGKNSKVVGFCWAQLLNAYDIEKSIKTVQYYQALGHPQLRQTLNTLMGDDSVIYLHDLGISNKYRGQVSLQQLIFPMLISLTQRTQVNRVLFWSIGSTRVYKLAERAGFKMVAEIQGMQFFIGDIKENTQTKCVRSKSSIVVDRQAAKQRVSPQYSACAGFMS